MYSTTSQNCTRVSAIIKLVWTRRAVKDVEDIVAYIADEDPEAAHDLADRVFSSMVETLADKPMIGRPGRVSGTREFVIAKSYIAVYRVDKAQIEILTVRHAARLWPSEF